MARQCSCGWCKNPVFSSGYCRIHQYMRVRDKNQSSKPRSPLRRTKPPLVSNKRSTAISIYDKVIKEMDKEAKEKGEYACFFCGEAIAGRASHHHLRGRQGALYLDKRYIIISHNHCHVDKYHRYTVAQLLETGWYGSFLVRLRKKDEITFAKEMRKLEKYFDI